MAIKKGKTNEVATAKTSVGTSIKVRHAKATTRVRVGSTPVRSRGKPGRKASKPVSHLSNSVAEHQRKAEIANKRAASLVKARAARAAKRATVTYTLSGAVPAEPRAVHDPSEWLVKEQQRRAYAAKRDKTSSKWTLPEVIAMTVLAAGLVLLGVAAARWVR